MIEGKIPRLIEGVFQTNNLLGIHMIRAAVFLLALLISSASYSCTVPIYGEEYDALIELTETQERHSYQIRVPARVDGSKLVKAFLAYTKLPKGEFMVGEFFSEIRLRKSSGDYVSAVFYAPEKEGYAPYVQVRWPGEVCATVASSEFPRSD
ncbi:hypothetical protein [Rheinheimera baltica]|uniref:hypothetical protein n=1 Tax=Rheinheimera baltica TaxID=67576 RepID=UPI0012EBC793|nr:hypothetical protein [Rheinheimera baltica]